MKKLILLISWLTALGVAVFAQCPAPSNLSAKQGDIVFAPVPSISVYEIYVDGSAIPVSTPTSVDNKGFYHYSYVGTAANWYSLPVKRNSVVKVRSFCISDYWYNYPYESNWQHYKADASKFSDWSASIVIK